MPHRTRPLAALLLFTGLNVVLVSTITPVYDFVCFHPYWERRWVFLGLCPLITVLLTAYFPNLFQRERRRQECEAALTGSAAA